VQDDGLRLPDYHERWMKLCVGLRELAVGSAAGSVAATALDVVLGRSHGNALGANPIGVPVAAFDIELALCARLLTKKGRDWHRERMTQFRAWSLALDGMSADDLQTRATLLEEEEAAAGKFADFALSLPEVKALGQPPTRERLVQRFRDYLEIASLAESRVPDLDVLRFWRSFAGSPSQEARAFGTASARLVSFPCSEAICERVFSWWKWVFTEERRGSSVDLIRAEMIIKAHDVFDEEKRETAAERTRRLRSNS
jgi:hypothetical protein